MVAFDHTRRYDIYLLICLAPQVLNDQVVRCFEPNCKSSGARPSCDEQRPVAQTHPGCAGWSSGYVDSRLVHKYHIVFVFAPVNSDVYLHKNLLKR